MIIGDNFIFIHNPKTAGSSFEKMMEDRYCLPVFGEQHNTAQDIPLDCRHYFKFGFMRDPIMSEVSNWRYHKSSWIHNDKFTFEQWCVWRYTQSQNYAKLFELSDDSTRYGHRFNVRPQAGYFVDEKGQCIADRIYRFTELRRSLAEIGDILNKDVSIDGYQVMQYGWHGEDYSQYVTPLAEQILRSAKAIDFELWEGGTIRTDFTCPTVPNYAYTR